MPDAAGARGYSPGLLTMMRLVAPTLALLAALTESRRAGVTCAAAWPEALTAAVAMARAAVIQRITYIRDLTSE